MSDLMVKHLLIVVTMALIAAGCDHEISVVPLPDGTANGPSYMGFGDSYSSGEGLDPYNSGTQDISEGGDRCHRSVSSYVELLPLTPAKNLNFRACAGAKIEHIYNVHQTHDGNPVTTGRQAANQLNATTDLITITIGGNDLRFSRIVKFCATHFDCANDTDWLDNQTDTTLREWAQQQFTQLPVSLEGTYQRLAFDAPNARVVVVGYPNLFAQDWTFKGQNKCFLYAGAFSKAERADINELTQRFNAVIAASALRSGVEYIHVAATFDGHETCGKQGQWLNFVDGFFGPGTFHPTEKGQRVVTRIVGCYLQQHASNPHSATPTLGPIPDTAAEVVGNIAVGISGDSIHQCALDFTQ